MEKIKRYKLKDDIKKEQLLKMGCRESENLSYICKGAVIGKTHLIKIHSTYEYKDKYGNLKTIKDTSEFDVEKNGITPDTVSPKDTESYWWTCKYNHPSFFQSVSHRVTRNTKCP